MKQLHMQVIEGKTKEEVKPK